ncbi:MAG: SGNH/GDSL hydrolase family protein [Halolamina sp.]
MTLPSRRRTLRLGGAGVVTGALGLLAGCSAPSDSDTETPAGERILALGDSYTVGTSVSNDERWVNKLVEKRREAGTTVAAPRVIAQNGWTTGDLDAAIDGSALADEYDLVTLLIGANNCFQGQPPEEFHPKFIGMLERAIGFAPAPERVVVITVPDYTLTPVGQRNNPTEHASRLAAYNDIIEEEARNAGTRFVDVVPPSEEVVGRPELVADDDLHPSGEQYDMWLERIYPVAEAALES